MATKKATGAEGAAQSGYWTVTVARPVPDVFGETFRPGVQYEVSDAVLEALGDSVATKTAVEHAG